SLFPHIPTLPISTLFPYTTLFRSYSLSQFEQEVVTLTNNERAKHGLQPLKVDLKLSEVARTKSSDMKSNGYFSHTSPTYGSPFEDRKSTRLNSSHVKISYAVFCLK